MQEERIFTDEERQAVINAIADLETKHPSINRKLSTTKNGVIVPAFKHKNAHLISMKEVKEELIEWLYPPYIPKGKITLCAAYPGVGKTYLLCYMAACVSTGRSFFDTIPFTGEPGKAVYLTAEDGLGDTIKARLKACGADMDNVYSVIDEDAVLTFDNPQIEDIIKEVRPDLVIFDPFQAYIGEDVELNAANKTRAKLNHIVELAAKYNTAIVLICHFNKNQKGDAITRIIGSTDIVGVSRSYLAIGTVPGDSKTRYMSHEKSSLEEKGKTILFEINPAEGGIKYLGDSEYTMDDYTVMASKNKQRAAPALDEAKEFIKRQMPDGKRLAKDMIELTKANGFSEKTVKRAKADLKIISKKDGFQGQYEWILPSDSQQVTPFE